MNLNKSIYGLVLLSIFILSSCSQAKYGMRTRKVKSTEIVQQKVSVDKTKKESGLIIAKGEDNGDKAEFKKIEGDVDQTLEKEDGEELTTQSSAPLPGVESVNVEGKTKRAIRSVIAAKRAIKETKGLSQKITKLKDMKDVQLAPTSTNSDVGGVLYIVLIVLLVLLILSLISKFLPILNWLLGIALLVLLIYILLQLI